ncbi:hypothetical protein M0Q50_06630 [bacterium]|jgi:hypothetical protein|nr:hypothetical protein [bacterium]
MKTKEQIKKGLTRSWYKKIINSSYGFTSSLNNEYDREIEESKYKLKILEYLLKSH